MEFIERTFSDYMAMNPRKEIQFCDCPENWEMCKKEFYGRNQVFFYRIKLSRKEDEIRAFTKF